MLIWLVLCSAQKIFHFAGNSSNFLCRIDFAVYTSTIYIWYSHKTKLFCLPATDNNSTHKNTPEALWCCCCCCFGLLSIQKELPKKSLIWLLCHTVQTQTLAYTITHTATYSVTTQWNILCTTRNCGQSMGNIFLIWTCCYWFFDVETHNLPDISLVSANKIRFPIHFSLDFFLLIRKSQFGCHT